MPQRVLVTGPRDYADRAFVWSTLDALHDDEPITCVIHGDAEGADAHAKAWAKDRGVEAKPYPARWDDLSGAPGRDYVIGYRRGKAYNKLAGFKRNGEMLRLSCPTLVAGFLDPKKVNGTPGTRDMLGKAYFAKRHGAALDVRTFRHPSSTF